MSFTDSPTSNENGKVARGNVAIDFNAALDILSQRVAALVEQERGHPSNEAYGRLPNASLNGSESINNCGCCLPGNVGDSKEHSGMKFQGQCIEIGSLADGDNALASLNDTQINAATVAIENEYHAALWKNQKEQNAAQQRAVARQEELEYKLRSMSVEDLITTVFQAQEGRVEAYRFYDEALEHILSTGNVHYYPPVCANVTGTFSVLSSTVNAVRSNLKHLESQSNIREIQELLARLQRAEQSKLQLTAALHLEQMRSIAELQKQQVQLNCNSAVREGESIGVPLVSVAEQKETVSKLLDESILLLRKKIALVIEEINDVLEDLRYSTPEKDDD